MTLTLNNTNTLTADNIIIGGTDLSEIYATKAEVGNNAQVTNKYRRYSNFKHQAITKFQ